MIAPTSLDSRYQQWNHKWGAPFGSLAHRLLSAAGHHRALLRIAPRVAGMFAFQPNNSTRAFEYPWAFFAADLAPTHRVVEIGGGLSGFQFVLSRLGCHVTNVDPGHAARGKGWHVDKDSIGRLNRAFRTQVELQSCTLQDSEIAAGTVDRIFSISTIEHIPPDELPTLMHRVGELLRPGGRFIATVDLFLNVFPFTTANANRYGTNINMRDLVTFSQLVLRHGAPQELYGFEEFDSASILAHLDEYLLGTYPALVQTVVLEKPVRAT